MQSQSYVTCSQDPAEPTLHCSTLAHRSWVSLLVQAGNGLSREVDMRRRISTGSVSRIATSMANTFATPIEDLLPACGLAASPDTINC